VDGFYNLGILYLKGLGVEKDFARARDLLVDAANKGHPKARYYLANMLHKGLAGIKKDLAHVSARFSLLCISSIASHFFKMHRYNIISTFTLSGFMKMPW